MGGTKELVGAWIEHRLDGKRRRWQGSRREARVRPVDAAAWVRDAAEDVGGGEVAMVSCGVGIVRPGFWVHGLGTTLAVAATKMVAGQRGRGGDE
jgi:hypothetical protein